MNTKTIIFSLSAGAAALIAAGVYMTTPGKYDPKMAEPFNRRYFAHRGLHKEDKSVPENTLAAFGLAADKGYGMELDVQMTKDKVCVVFHDGDLKRIFGIDKNVSDFTLEELKELDIYGTGERIPTFKEMLDLIDGRSPLIVELKPETGKKRIELCMECLALLRDYREKTGGDFCVESFDPFIVKWFRKNAPDLFRGQLTMPAKNYDHKIPFLARLSMSLCLYNFAAKPHFIAYFNKKPSPILGLAKLLGAKAVAWTSRTPGDSPGADAIIFEFYEPEQRF